MKRIAIFGSTGSVGVQSLSVINQKNDQFKIVCLSCNGNADLLFEQTKHFMPEKIAINVLDIVSIVNIILGVNGLGINSENGNADISVNNLIDNYEKNIDFYSTKITN